MLSPKEMMQLPNEPGVWLNKRHPKIIYVVHKSSEIDQLKVNKIDVDNGLTQCMEQPVESLPPDGWAKVSCPESNEVQCRKLAEYCVNRIRLILHNNGVGIILTNTLVERIELAIAATAMQLGFNHDT